MSNFCLLKLKNMCVFFSENGECLFAGTSSAVSVIGWEPDREFDQIMSSWSTLGDMKIINRRLVN